MAMDINIRITVDTEGTYSDHEASILRALAAHPSQGDAAEWPPADRAVSKVEVPAAVTPAAKKPVTRAPKAAAPKKPTPAPDVPMALEDPLVEEAPAVVVEEEVPGDPQEDAVSQAAPSTAPLTQVAGVKLTQPVQRTLDGAVTVVTELVAQGKIAPAKSALEAAGVKKVSLLETAEQVATFFAALEG